MRGAVLLRESSRKTDDGFSAFASFDRRHLAGGGFPDAREDRDVLDRFAAFYRKALLALDDPVGTGEKLGVKAEAVVA